MANAAGTDPQGPEGERRMWDRHWRSLQPKTSLFGRIASWVRYHVLCPAVAHYTGKWFAKSGVFVEAGCGTGQASSAMQAGSRRLIGLDVSLAALLSARGRAPYHALVIGDLRNFPFADGSLAGIWNLGVMEHFYPGDGQGMLRELRRALSPEGVALLFWPPTFGSSRLVLAPIEALRSLLSGRRFRFFPDEVNRLRSRGQARAALAEAGLETAAVDFTARDAFIHYVVVGRRSSTT